MIVHPLPEHVRVDGFLAGLCPERASSTHIGHDYNLKQESSRHPMDHEKENSHPQILRPAAKGQMLPPKPGQGAAGATLLGQKSGALQKENAVPTAAYSGCNDGAGTQRPTLIDSGPPATPASVSRDDFVVACLIDKLTK